MVHLSVQRLNHYYCKGAQGLKLFLLHIAQHVVKNLLLPTWCNTTISHVIIQSANYVAAPQPRYRSRASVNVYIKHQNRDKCDPSNFDCGIVFGLAGMSISETADPLGFLGTTVSRVQTECYKIKPIQ